MSFSYPEDEVIHPTVVAIGSTGVGKSTFLNGALQGQNLISQPVFQASSDMDACTSETRASIGHVFNVNSFNDENFPKFRFVDTPGQNEGES